MNSVDGILQLCAAEVQDELNQLMRQLDPAVHLTHTEAIGILAILRAAHSRLSHQPPPRTPKPQPRPSRRLQAV